MSKIALVINDILRFGGAERYLLEQAKYLKEKNFEVRIFTWDFNDKLYKFSEFKRDITVVEAGDVRLQLKVQSAVKQIGSWNPDLVIAHAQPANIIAYKVFKKYKINYILNIHGTFINFENDLLRYSNIFRDKFIEFIKTNDSLKEFAKYDINKGFSFKRKFQLEYWAKLDYKSFINSSVIVVLSEHVKKNVKYFYGVDSIIHHPGHLKKESYVKPELDIDFSKRLFIFIGRLDKRKRVSLIIDAVNLLPDNIRDGIQCLIIGEGEERLKLENKVKDLGLGSEIKIIGNLSDDNINWLFKNSTAMIYPAWVTYGLVVIEGLVEDLNIIVSSDTGIAGELGDINNLFVVKPEPENIKGAIEKILKNNSEIDSSSKVIKEFSYSKAFDLIFNNLKDNFIIPKKKDDLNILMLPLFSNPFQKLLIDILKRNQCNILTDFRKFNRTWLRNNSNKIDILHLHWLDPFYLNVESSYKAWVYSKNFLSKLKYLKKNGVKIIWTVHNLENHNKKYLKIDRRVRRKLFSLVDRIIIMSDYAKTRLEDSYKIKISNSEVIPLPNYIGIYKDEVTKTDAREKFGLHEDDKVILFLGLIKRYKGVDVLFNSKIFRESNNIKWIIAGRVEPEEYKLELEKKFQGLNNVITNFKYIPDDELQYFFRAADAAILPYTDFLTSSNLLLSMSFKLPGICSDHGFFREILKGTENLFFNANEPGSLNKVIEKVFDSNLEKIGEENYKLMQKYSPETIAGQTLKLYRSL